MTEVVPQAVSALADGDLRAFVERSIREHFAAENCIVRVERRLNDYHSSFALEELTVYFEDSGRLPLIFKNLSPHGLLEYARQIRPQFSYQPAREIVVYRDILAAANLGTPTCYGALIDAQNEHYWLLLEKVTGNPLSKTGEFAIWCDAARWLAHLHAHLAHVVDRHVEVGNLLSYDEEFFDVWIDRAENFCELRERAGQNGAPTPISWLADRCRAAVRQICRLPRTFIHGEFYASNVLISQEESGTRICPIDWETAAVGPALLDLAALVAGDWSESRRTELARAYYDALPPAANVYQSIDVFFQLLRCCRLFLAVKWLGWSSDWLAPDEHRRDWLTDATELATTVESH